MNNNFKVKYQTLSTSAFTLVELVFVLVIAGILLSIGSTYIPKNKLLNDTDYIVSQIKNKQKNAIGDNLYNFGEVLWGEPAKDSSDYNATCVDFDKQWLEQQDRHSPNPYKFAQDINITSNHICFDNIGRPYRNNKLLHNIMDINISNSDKINEILIFPMSGYVIIKWNISK